MAKNSLREYFYYLSRYLVYGFTTFAFVIGAYFGARWFYYIHLDGYTLPTVVEPIEILNADNVVRINEPIVMELHISKPELITTKEARVDITCEGGNLITLASSGGTLPEGEYKITSDRYVMPPKANPGDVCQFNFRQIYIPNPYVETEQVTFSSEQFTIGE